MYERESERRSGYDMEWGRDGEYGRCIRVAVGLSAPPHAYGDTTGLKILESVFGLPSTTMYTLYTETDSQQDARARVVRYGEYATEPHLPSSAR